MTAKTNVLASSILSKAADILEAGGWCQGSEALDADGKPVLSHRSTAVKHCMVGAVYRAKSDLGCLFNDSSKTSGEYLYSAIEKSGSDYTLASWNDSPERTKAEVVAVLREAAELAQVDEASAI